MEALFFLGGIIAAIAAEVIVLLLPIMLWVGGGDDASLTRKTMLGLWLITYGSLSVAVILGFASLHLFGLVR